MDPQELAVPKLPERWVLGCVWFVMSCVLIGQVRVLTGCNGNEISGLWD